MPTLLEKRMNKVYIEMKLDTSLKTHPTTLVDLFARYGCPTGIGRQIADELIEAGYRKMTVLPSLDFVSLAADLAVHAVKMNVLSKIPQKKRK